MSLTPNDEKQNLFYNIHILTNLSLSHWQSLRYNQHTKNTRQKQGTNRAPGFQNISSQKKYFLEIYMYSVFIQF
jgi:hypothetical protein